MKNASNWLENSISCIRKLDSEIHRIETRILEILLEIERRKAYAELRYDGLFSFCIKEFRWSESQAYSRIQAMRAMRAVPQVKEMIDEGRMSVTTAAQVQVYLRQEDTDAGIKRTPEEKREIFESFQNMTAKEVKLELAERKGERILQRLLIELDEEGETLWREVKSRSAHQNRGSELNCLKLLMKGYLKQTESKASKPAQAPKPAQASNPQRGSAGSTQKQSVDGDELSPAQEVPRLKVKPPTSVGLSPSKAAPLGTLPTKAIPAKIRRQVFARDQNRCQNCGSNHALQCDHIIALALGGETTVNNLRTLCRNCNLQKGIRDFGPGPMKRDSFEFA
jgi:hypothetical protein